PQQPGAAAPAPAGAREALQIIREVEVDPFREDEPFRAKVAALMMWVIQSPDLTVVLCSDLYPDLDSKAHPRDSVLLAQIMFSQAGYLIEHPGTTPRDEAVLTAGISGGIRAYRKLVAAHPDERRAAWDQLDAAERKNDLPRALGKAMKECREHARQ